MVLIRQYQIDRVVNFWRFLGEVNIHQGRLRLIIFLVDDLADDLIGLLDKVLILLRLLLMKLLYVVFRRSLG